MGAFFLGLAETLGIGIAGVYVIVSVVSLGVLAGIAYGGYKIYRHYNPKPIKTRLRDKARNKVREKRGKDKVNEAYNKKIKDKNRNSIFDYVDGKSPKSKGEDDGVKSFDLGEEEVPKLNPGQKQLEEGKKEQEVQDDKPIDENIVPDTPNEPEVNNDQEQKRSEIKGQSAETSYDTDDSFAGDEQESETIEEEAEIEK